MSGQKTLLFSTIVFLLFTTSLLASPYWFPDLDGDDFVNFVDFARFANNWQQSGSGLDGDFDNSETVDMSDLAYVARYWLADVTSLEYYADSLPYLTSFEGYQQFDLGNLDYQNRWQVLSGAADVNEAGNYQYVYIHANSTVSKIFDDTGSNHTYIRCQIYPGDGAKVQVFNDANIVAAVEFNADTHIHVLDGSSFLDTGVSWSSGYFELKLVMDYDSDDYDVLWNGSSVLTSNAAFGIACDTLTEVEFQTGDSDWVKLDRLSISDEIGDGSETNWSITEPGGGGDDKLEGRVPLKGHIWWHKLGKYEIKFCPDDLDDSDPANWFTTYVGWNPVESGEIVGYWDTSAMPNGYYHLGIIVYDDTGSSSLGLQKLMSGPALKTFVIASDLKCNTFHYEEKADISVPWPGQFPFEFRRTYNNNHRFYSKPIRNGWTSNNQITLVEDTTYWYEPLPLFPQFAAYDGSWLAFGHIWITYPDGSKQLFLHDPPGTTSYETTVYRPRPNHSSGDYIERTTYYDWLDWYVDVTYVLKKRDGTSITFNTVTLWDHPCYGANYGWEFGKVSTKMGRKADRFGNTLTYGWYGTQAVTSISDGTRKIELDISGGYYTQAQLKIGSQVYRTVEYDWNSSNKTFKVTKTGYGVDPNGVYDGGTLKEYETQYQYDDGLNLIKIVYDDDIANPSIEIEYDDYGRVALRKDYVDPNNYLVTSYEYIFYHPDPNNEYVSNLKTVATTQQQEVAIIQDKRGNVLEQDTVADDDSAVTDVNVFYNDTYQNPLKPTDVNEYFDGMVRRTWNSYNSYGDLIEQKVYVDDVNFVSTEMTYHPRYSLVKSRTNWQDVNETGQKVETLYIYGNADGTENPNYGVYLVKEKVLLSQDPDLWAVTSYEYYDNGLVKKKTDPNQFITFYEYDNNGYNKLIKMGTADSNEPVRRFYYDVIGQLRILANNLGGVVLSDYDDFGRLWKVRRYVDGNAMTITDASFVPSRYEAMTPISTVIYGYDQNGNQTYEQKEAGGQIFIDYILSSLPEKITYDDGSFVQYHYDSRGLKIEEDYYDAITSLDWHVTFAYDSMGRIIDTRWYDYDNISIVKREAGAYYGSGRRKYDHIYGYGDVLEKQTDYYYDILGRMTSRVVAPGSLDLTTSYEYDAVGNRISVIDPNGSIIYFDYDNANCNIAEYFATEPLTDPNVKKEIWYYENGLIKDVNFYDYNDTLLSRSEFQYDARRRITKVTQDINNVEQAVTIYDYSDAGFGPGNKYHIRITDANDKYTYIALDPFTRRVKTLYPSEDYQELLYNGDGTLAAKVVWDANDTKHWIEYYYDGYARLTDVNYPDGGNVHYTYDGFGRKTSVKDNRNPTDNIGGSGKIAYEYDVLGRVDNITDHNGYRIRYGYQADGQKNYIAVTEPNDANSVIYHVEYWYDAANRLENVFEPPLGMNGYVAEFKYDDNGNRKQLEYFLTGSPMGATLSIDYSYDLDNNLTGFTTTGGPTFTLSNTTIDGLGRLLYADEAVTKNDSNTVEYRYEYEYDMRSSLIFDNLIDLATSDVYKTTYTYDLAGNMLSRVYNDGVEDYWDTTYTYDGDQVVQTAHLGGGQKDIVWDENGRQITKSHTSPSHNALEYDWDGRLRAGDGWGTGLGMEARYTPDGVRIYKHRIWNLDSYWHKYIVDMVGEIPNILLVLDANDNNAIVKTYVHANNQILMQHDGDVNSPRYFYLHDRLGSVRQIINSSGVVENHYFYDSWGYDWDEGENVSNWYWFAGYYLDGEVSQFYCNARQYEILLGRFTSRDPVRGSFNEPMTLHAYLYCLNDPVNSTDPTGEIPLALAFSMGIRGGLTAKQIGAVVLALSYAYVVCATHDARSDALAYLVDSVGSGLDRLGDAMIMLMAANRAAGWRGKTIEQIMRENRIRAGRISRIVGSKGGAKGPKPPDWKKILKMKWEDIVKAAKRGEAWARTLKKEIFKPENWPK